MRPTVHAVTDVTHSTPLCVGHTDVYVNLHKLLSHCAGGAPSTEHEPAAASPQLLYQPSHCYYSLSDLVAMVIKSPELICDWWSGVIDRFMTEISDRVSPALFFFFLGVFFLLGLGGGFYLWVRLPVWEAAQRHLGPESSLLPNHSYWTSMENIMGPRTDVGTRVKNKPGQDINNGQRDTSGPRVCLNLQRGINAADFCVLQSPQLVVIWWPLWFQVVTTGVLYLIIQVAEFCCK